MCFAFFVALLVLIAAFGVDRQGWVDELGFLNPPYMLAHFGKLTFNSYAAGWFFDQPVITHPPIHTFWIGLLWRLGFTIYYAEALPTVLLFLLSIALIVRGAFPDVVKLGLLFSVGYVMAAGETLTLCFGTRPEGELHAAWLCGLVLLESGRLANWNRASLAAGAFMLTWASGVHYYAGLAFTGVAVYAVWAVRSLGWKDARPRLAAMGAGGCLFGIPYLALYLVPYWKDVWAIIVDTQGSGGVAASIRRHEEMYRGWSTVGDHPVLIRTVMAWKIPLLAYTTAILLAVRWTRGLALAALPLQAFLFLFAWHKLDPYLLHESALFAGALAIGILVLFDRLVARLPASIGRGFVPAAAVCLTVWLAARSPMLANSTLSEEPRIHEVEVARAAAREILGPNPRVGGHWGEWYASGATHWYNTQFDIQFGALLLDPRTYFSNLDAIVDCPFFCVSTPERSTSGWYADGTVKLRGFYFGESNDQLQFVLLSANQPPQLVGYSSYHHQLYRFEQQPEGNYQVISAVCPQAQDLGEWGWLKSWPGVYSSVLQIPKNSPDVGRLMVTLLAPRNPAPPVDWMNLACRTISRVPGSLLLADRKAMVARLRRDDPPMHFYRLLDQVPGYTGVGLPPELAPPQNAVRLDHVIDFSKMAATNGASFDPEAPRRLTTMPHMGGFAASIPVIQPGGLTGPGWVELQLRVLNGRVGFLAWDQAAGKLLARTVGIAAAKDPQTVALRVPDFHAMTSVIITNESPISARADILDVAILVPR